MIAEKFSSFRQALPVESLEQALEQISAVLPAEMICICEYHPETGVAPVLDRGVLSLSAEAQSRLRRLLRESIDAHPAPRLWDASVLRQTPFAAALIVPIAQPERVLGAVALFSTQANRYQVEDAARIRLPLEAVRLVLENQVLRTLVAQNLTTAQSILATAQAIAENPSPQHVVDILHDTLFESHITSCAMLLYGPMREDRPSGPFDYLEIRGTWSKRHGSGVGTGVRLYLKDYPDLLRRLDEDKVIIYRDAAEIRERFDPLVRSFMRAERVRSLTLLTLQSARRKLGVIVIGTDKPHIFEQAELHNYRTVSEFLAISAMAQLLQQEHDRVQQGRAALLDAVTDGVVMVTPQGHGGRVLTLNQRFTRIFDVPEARAQGLTLMDLLAQLPLPEDTRADLRQQWLSVPVRDPKTYRGEFHMTHSDGHPLEIEWYSAPVYQESFVLGRIYIFHDVTAERTAMRLRADFLSRVSHELRTPLTSIRGFAEFILEVTGDKLPDLAREYTEIILSSSKHLKRIFDDMIEISRADAGQLKLNREDAHLPDIIIDVAARMELSYKARKQTLILDLDDDLPRVNVDIDRVIQVVTNLLSNAIKYSPEGTTIRINAHLVRRLGELPEGAPPDVVLPAALVSVHDGGRGLTRAEIETVFLPFFRTEAAKKQKVEGVGLGLAVTRSIVEMHRGKIWAEPNDRAPGGLFRFTVPVMQG